MLGRPIADRRDGRLGRAELAAGASRTHRRGRALMHHCGATRMPGLTLSTKRTGNGGHCRPKKDNCQHHAYVLLSPVHRVKLRSSIVSMHGIDG